MATSQEGWCKKRVSYPGLFLRFQDGKHRFFLESVCTNPLGAQTGNLCYKCSYARVQTKTQDSHTFPHGLVTGEYSPESHLYDSPWYHESVKNYGPPSTEDITLAMEAQRRSRNGTKTKAMKDLFAALASKNAASEESEVTVTLDMPSTKSSPPKSSPKPIEPIEQKETKETKSQKEADPIKEKVKRKPRAKKVVEPPSPVSVVEVLQKPVATSVPATIKLAEKEDDPIEVRTIVQIVLRTLTHNGKAYWRDGEREKLYEKTKSGDKGSYVGRWDSTSERIVRDAPDTDEDD
jgi:outer membrane biosynthesis protein TonB